jgi:hypothetical protein
MQSQCARLGGVADQRNCRGDSIPCQSAIAHFDCGAGTTQIRWYHWYPLEHGEAGWLTNAASVATEQALVAGLDIVPWGE